MFEKSNPQRPSFGPWSAGPARLAGRPTLAAIVAFLAVGGISLADYFTGTALSFSVFYLAPIGVASWYISSRLGAALAVTSAVAWLVADIAAHETYTRGAVPFFNALVRLTIFLLVNTLVGRLRSARDQLERTVEARTSALAAEVVEHQRTEEALRQSERFVQRIADTVPGILFVVDLEEGRTVYVNRQLAGILGYTSETFSDPARIAELAHPDDRAEARRVAARWTELDEAESAELRLRDSAGTWHWLDFRSVVFSRTSSGRPKQVLGIAHDITEQKRLEAEMQARQGELAHVMRLSTASELAAGLAHELKQPLAAIRSYADGSAMRVEAGSIDNDELLRALSFISSQAARAGKIIADLRDFMGKREAQRSVFDLHAAIATVAQFAAPEAQSQLVRLRLDLPPEPPLVRGDHIQIEQVLLNLVRNGLDALGEERPDRPEIAIRTWRPEPGSVEVSVRNNGKELPAAAERVFEPFFTTKEQGMGMGLAIAHSIVTNHGGRLYCSSSRRGEVTFNFTLPTCSESGPPEDPGARTPP